MQTFFIRYFWLPLVRFVLDVKFLPNQLHTVYLRWRYGGPENYPPHIQPSARELQAVERLINLTSSANALRKVFGLREEDCVVFHALHLQLNTKLDDVDLATKFNSVMYSETPKREMYAIMQELEDIKPHQITYRFSDPAERAKFEAWLDTSVWQRYETFTAPQSDCDHDPR